MSPAARTQQDDRSSPSPRQFTLSPSVVLMILLNIITAVMAFATVKNTQDTQTEQIRELQQNTVTRREMDDVKNWLQRIDGKLDKALEKK